MVPNRCPAIPGKSTSNGTVVLLRGGSVGTRRLVTPSTITATAARPAAADRFCDEDVRLGVGCSIERELIRVLRIGRANADAVHRPGSASGQCTGGRQGTGRK